MLSPPNAHGFVIVSQIQDINKEMKSDPREKSEEVDQ